MTISVRLTGSPYALTFTGVLKRVSSGLDFLSPVADLAVRLWVANVFFESGLVKIPVLGEHGCAVYL